MTNKGVVISVFKKVSIGLTQFTDFTFKGVTGKTSMVRQIKYQDEYNPAFDYWKPLRDGIRKFHENEFSNDYLLSLANKVAQAKQKITWKQSKHI